MPSKLFVPGGPAGGELVTVRVTGEGLHIEAAHGSLSLGWSGLDANLAGFDDAWVALSSARPEGRIELWVERAFMPELDAYSRFFSPEFSRRWATLRGTDRTRGRLRWLLRSAAVVGVVGLLWFVLGGGIGGLVVRLAPTSLDGALGVQAMEETLRSAGPCTNPETQSALQSVLDALLAEVPENPYAFKLILVADPAPNMGALPGGVVLVTVGMFPLLQDSSEVAAVLGHEIQHVLGRHWLHLTARRLGLGAVAAVLFGDASGVIATLGQLQGLKFGRDLERDSDRVGLQLMAAAGFDPAGAARMFERIASLEEEAGGFSISILQTHPATAERVEDARLAARELPVPAAARLAELDWSAAARGCAEASP